jgi:hypothetical protein
MPLFQHIFEPIPFKDEKKSFIHNNFQTVGYYSGFYSSLCDQKLRNGDFLTNKVVFQCILRILPKYEYTCNSENNFQTIVISSFLIVQRAVKARIIARLLKIIKNFFSSLNGRCSNKCWKGGILLKNDNFCKF